VGNFGKGSPSINSFIPAVTNFSGSGAPLGSLPDEGGTPIQIDGLRALTFGNGGNGGDPQTLYFSAGIADQEHGLFGSIALAAISLRPRWSKPSSLPANTVRALDNHERSEIHS
jgi:hypothetical protein